MKILTSEAVFKGHPDKICDQISDAVLDECLKQDKSSRVAIESLIKNNLVVIAGEVTTKAKLDYAKIVTKVLTELGYENLQNFRLLVEVSKQSEDIALGVNKDGAGDQGIVFGYASNESKELMPLPIVLARRIAIRMDELSRNLRELFGADGKCQVSIAYDQNDVPVKVTTVVVSQQTSEGLDRDFYTSFITEECVKKVIPSYLLDKDTQILINPTGEFVKGGAYADSGLTGRKIIVDTYGGLAKHGGGAFSGKDVTKVDRLGAYYARYVAKNIVAAGLAKKCEIQVGYAIGVAKPVSINIETFGTSKYTNEQILEAVNKFFNFSPKAMKNEIIDDSISFKALAEYGHVGKSDIPLNWEKTNKAFILRTYFKAKYGKTKSSNSSFL